MTEIRPDWDAVWMQMADTIAQRSRCSRAKVGAVIVSADQRVLSSSYNGPPRGLQVDGECINWCPRAQTGVADPLYDNCHAAHAESNALARADYSQMQGSTMYITTSICKGCAKIVANSGVTNIVYRASSNGEDAYRDPASTRVFLVDCGIGVWTYENTINASIS